MKESSIHHGGEAPLCTVGRKGGIQRTGGGREAWQETEQIKVVPLCTRSCSETIRIIGDLHAGAGIIGDLHAGVGIIGDLHAGVGLSAQRGVSARTVGCTEGGMEGHTPPEAWRVGCVHCGKHGGWGACTAGGTAPSVS